MDSLIERIVLLAGFPYLGRSREEDFGFECRSFAVGDYVIVYCVEGEDVFVLRVGHGRRDLDALFP
ncbi:MAG: type II toxin-antitoxin system RelE/ParE family toxin [Gammaproteobacteria bacterium]|nr:type II toxin-antitoxin system RelE/ParE family toxin [Gammaproteobacteria bacterium]